MERGNIFYREIIMEYPSKICSTSELNLITKNIFKNVLKEELIVSSINPLLHHYFFQGT